MNVVFEPFCHCDSSFYFCVVCGVPTRCVLFELFSLESTGKPRRQDMPKSPNDHARKLLGNKSTTRLAVVDPVFLNQMSQSLCPPLKKRKQKKKKQNCRPTLTKRLSQKKNSSPFLQDFKDLIHFGLFRAKIRFGLSVFCFGENVFFLFVEGFSSVGFPFFCF